MSEQPVSPAWTAPDEIDRLIAAVDAGRDEHQHAQQDARDADALTATTVLWSLCTCDDGAHAYPDCDRPEDWAPDRGTAERTGVFIPASTPRHLLRRTSAVSVDVVQEDS